MRKQKKADYVDTQVFTPPAITHQMLDLLDQSVLADEEANFFEPSCGNGQMLEVIVDRLYQAMLSANGGDRERALAATCVRFYAIEIDPAMVRDARRRIYDVLWNMAKDCDMRLLCQWFIAWLVHQRIECKDFFEFMKQGEESWMGRVRSLTGQRRRGWSL